MFDKISNLLNDLFSQLVGSLYFMWKCLHCPDVVRRPTVKFPIPEPRFATLRSINVLDGKSPCSRFRRNRNRLPDQTVLWPRTVVSRIRPWPALRIFHWIEPRFHHFWAVYTVTTIRIRHNRWPLQPNSITYWFLRFGDHQSRKTARSWRSVRRVVLTTIRLL